MTRTKDVRCWPVFVAVVAAVGGMTIAPAWAAERTFLITTGEWSWEAKPGEAPVVDRGLANVRKIERYVFDPGFIVVDKGDRVTLSIHTLKGDKHMVEIPAFRTVEIQIARGEEKSVTFIADKAGVFEFRCNNHVSPQKEGPMIGYIYVLDKK